jgi:hypothetical protein
VTSENPESQLQEVLDAKEGKEWHLVGVAGGLQGEAWSSFGTQRSLASAEEPTDRAAGLLRGRFGMHWRYLPSMRRETCFATTPRTFLFLRARTAIWRPSCSSVSSALLRSCS